MELILIAVLALVVLGGVDRRLHPQRGQGQPAASRRAPVRRRGSTAPAHRVAVGQVRPFLSLGPAVRRQG